MLPYIYKPPQNIKNKNVQYVPTISGNVWNPILFFLIMNIFLYGVFLLRSFYGLITTNTDTNSTNKNDYYKYLSCLIIIGVSLLYTLFGLILMMDYIIRAYNVWDFKVIMALLFALAAIKFTMTDKNKNTLIYIYTLICITLVVLISLMIKEFNYYITK